MMPTPGRPRFLRQPRGMAFQIEAADYACLLQMLDEYRHEHPRAQMSDLLRQIIGRAIDLDPATPSET